jgi:hypothetical protein
MPFKCRYPYCPNTRDNSFVSFHKFPKKEEMRRKWLRCLNLHVNPGVWDGVCSNHFDANRFTKHSNGKKYLKANSVPHSVFVGKTSCIPPQLPPQLPLQIEAVYCGSTLPQDFGVIDCGSNVQNADGFLHVSDALATAKDPLADTKVEDPLLGINEDETILNPIKNEFQSGDPSRDSWTRALSPHDVKEIIHVDDPGRSASVSPTVCVSSLDHTYNINPDKLKQKYDSLKRNYKKLKVRCDNGEAKIKRLEIKVAFLKRIVKDYQTGARR